MASGGPHRHWLVPTSPNQTPWSEALGRELEEGPADPGLVVDLDQEELEIVDEADPARVANTPDAEQVEATPIRVVPRPTPPRPWGGNRGVVSPEDLSPEELTPEMRWPPGSWVKVTDVVRHSTGEVIEGISVGDVGQVIAALSQTLVLLFPTRDNRREVIHIESIEAVEVKPGGRR